ncbi:peroxidase family protein [Silvimonas soli]|uniref:peroxidase family protein n=1 Tax=Silvimonas soli TaxID=2980100 RepID=UPI0024B3AFF3|nr:peroxidase family protein [Silvimonas soli]
MDNQAGLSRHGTVGERQTGFERLLPQQPGQPGLAALQALATAMTGQPDDPSDGPDHEENLYVPAGYTYFGQFIDHDLTFDTTSSLSPASGPNSAEDQRTPRLDLDCVYGSGPDDQPYMYAGDGASLLLGVDLDGLHRDLLRSAPLGRAVIGDPRNDENSIVNQIQSSFIRFHNAVVVRLAQQGLQGAKLFQAARNEVRWTYQNILTKDYLPRIISKTVLDQFAHDRSQGNAYKLFKLRDDGPRLIPLEFSGAVYRFGHSMVRNGYRLNDATVKHIFAEIDGSPDDSLVGFEPLPASHVISDWGRFLPHPDNEQTEPGNRAAANNDTRGASRLQFAYKMDTNIADPLANLPPAVDGGAGPSLIFRNLARARLFQLPMGEQVAAALGVPALSEDQLVVRAETTAPGAETKTYRLTRLTDISAEFKGATPLWAYILAEAQLPLVKLVLESGKQDSFDEDFMLDNSIAQGAQLGAVGGRLLLEVFNGLLDDDADSYRGAAAKNWKPLIRHFRLWDVVHLNFRP